MIGDWIKDGISAIMNIINPILYYLESMLCMVINWLGELFEVFSGINTVKFGKSDDYLLNIFINNSAVYGIFLGMAMIGIVLTFVFAVISVVRKSFDADEKVRITHGQILRNLLRSILFIITLNLVITIAVASSSTLMDSVMTAFKDAEYNAQGSGHIEYTDEQFAAMSRILNTVGNYSLNPSYKNRYNINACYNEIRGDLQYLDNTGVFNYYYPTTNKKGSTVNTWQSVISEIAAAGDFNEEVPIDSYDEGIANALYHCVEVLNKDNNFAALESFDRERKQDEENVHLDRVLFLIGTMGSGNTAAARNDAYNKSPSLYDNVRAPYYYGDKDIYKLDQVNEDFDISLTKTNYLVIYLAGTALIANMAIIVVSCVVRIFNLIFLYLIAPPIFSTMPLDDGQKFKQWITAFIIQAFSIFATVISMRLFTIFVPIIMDPKLELSSNMLVNYVGKLIFVCAGTYAVQKANGLLTGILADMAGHQSVLAGDLSSDVAGSTIGRIGASLTSRLENTPVDAAMGAGGLALQGAWWGVGKVGQGAGRLTGGSGGSGGGDGGGDGGSGGNLPGKSNLGGGTGGSPDDSFNDLLGAMNIPLDDGGQGEYIDNGPLPGQLGGLAGQDEGGSLPGRAGQGVEPVIDQNAQENAQPDSEIEQYSNILGDYGDFGSFGDDGNDVPDISDQSRISGAARTGGAGKAGAGFVSPVIPTGDPNGDLPEGQSVPGVPADTSGTADSSGVEVPSGSDPQWYRMRNATPWAATNASAEDQKVPAGFAGADGSLPGDGSAADGTVDTSGTADSRSVSMPTGAQPQYLHLRNAFPGRGVHGGSAVPSKTPPPKRRGNGNGNRLPPKSTTGGSAGFRRLSNLSDHEIMNAINSDPTVADAMRRAGVMPSAGQVRDNFTRLYDQAYDDLDRDARDALGSSMPRGKGPASGTSTSTKQQPSGSRAVRGAALPGRENVTSGTAASTTQQPSGSRVVRGAALPGREQMPSSKQSGGSGEGSSNDGGSVSTVTNNAPASSSSATANVPPVMEDINIPTFDDSPVMQTASINDVPTDDQSDISYRDISGSDRNDYKN